jgi:hypothetical protein
MINDQCLMVGWVCVRGFYDAFAVLLQLFGVQCSRIVFRLSSVRLPGFFNERHKNAPTPQNSPSE